MLKFSRPEGELTEDFMRRTNSSIKHLVTNHNVAGWDVLAHRAVHRWAGKLVQIEASDPTRITSVVFNHRDWAWIQTIAVQNGGRQLHGRYLKTWRWERPLYKYHGNEWRTIARDTELWADKEADFLTWRLINR